MTYRDSCKKLSEVVPLPIRKLILASLAALSAIFIHGSCSGLHQPVHGPDECGSARRMFALIEGGDIAARPNVKELFAWNREEWEKLKASGSEPEFPHGLMPAGIYTFPELKADGTDARKKTVFGVYWFAGEEGDPQVFAYVLGRDIIAVRGCRVGGTPRLVEKWRIFDDARFVEYLQRAQSVEVPKDWTKQDSHRIWW